MRARTRCGAAALAVAAVVALAPAPGHGQEVPSEAPRGGTVDGADAPTPWGLWLTLGGGGGTLERAPFSNDGGPMLHLSFAFQRGAHLIELGGSRLFDGYDGLGETALLYGRATRTGWGHLSAAAGLAAVQTDPDLSTVLGVPLVVAAGFRPGVLGVGIRLAGNLNQRRSFATVALTLSLGRFPGDGEP